MLSLSSTRTLSLAPTIRPIQPPASLVLSDCQTKCYNPRKPTAKAVTTILRNSRRSRSQRILMIISNSSSSTQPYNLVSRQLLHHRHQHQHHHLPQYPNQLGQQPLQTATSTIIRHITRHISSSSNSSKFSALHVRVIIRAMSIMAAEMGEGSAIIITAGTITIMLLLLLSKKQ